MYRTLEQAKWRESSRALIRTHNHQPRYRLVQLLKHYGLPRSGRRAALVARLTAHEATIPTPPFVAVTVAGEVLEFLRLPTEIRVMVFKELLTLKNIDSPRRARITNILSVNKQIYNEAKGFLYSLNTIEIRLDDWNRLWLGDSPRIFYITRTRLDNLPSYLRRCERIKVVLSVEGSYWNGVRPEDTDKLLTNFNSLMYTLLMDHEHLRDIQIKLQVNGGYKFDMTSTLTDEQMRSFEQGCLNTFCHLRGMHAVSLTGFTFIDPFALFLAKHTVSLPSMRPWKSFATLPAMIQAAPQWWQLRTLSKPRITFCTELLTNRSQRHSLQPFRTLRCYQSESRQIHFHSFSQTGLGKPYTTKKDKTSDSVLAILSYSHVSTAPGNAAVCSSATSSACSFDCEAPHSEIS